MTAPISHLELFLNTTFEKYSQVGPDSEELPVVFHRAKQYSLPVDLVPHVHGVFLAVEIPPAIVHGQHKQASHSRNNNLRGQSAEKMQSNTSSQSSYHQGKNKMHPLYNGYVTPAVLNGYYNINSNTGSASVAQDVFAALGQTLSPSDLSAFQSTFNLPQQPIAGSIGTIFKERDL